MITARYRSGNNLGGKQEAGQVLQIDSNRWRCAAKRKNISQVNGLSGAGFQSLTFLWIKLTKFIVSNKNYLNHSNLNNLKKSSSDLNLRIELQTHLSLSS